MNVCRAIGRTFLVFSTIFWSACSRGVSDSQILPVHDDSKPIASATREPANLADDNFAREWKRRFDSTLSELEANYRLWKEAGLKSYKFVAAKTGAGGVTNSWDRLPVVITVQDGIRTSIEKKSKGKENVIYSRTDGFEDFDTVDKLFDYLRQELKSGRMLAVTYHKKLGYPRNVQIALSYAIHGGRAIEISDFERLK